MNGTSPPQTKARNVRQYVNGISSTFRSRIRRAYLAKGGTYSRFSNEQREILAEAIFEVENDLEHRMPHHDQVTAMRAARNRVYDDLRWNEYA